mmetsp:Transcript_5600/g.9686  ORF Transcript_5600/g.9686 Transcript_5600/m.9686 type:complete len:233 (+) Transcript_5600:200-898(+)
MVALHRGLLLDSLRDMCSGTVDPLCQDDHEGAHEDPLEGKDGEGDGRQASGVAGLKLELGRDAEDRVKGDVVHRLGDFPDLVLADSGDDDDGAELQYGCKQGPSEKAPHSRVAVVLKDQDGGEQDAKHGGEGDDVEGEHGDAGLVDLARGEGGAVRQGQVRVVPVVHVPRGRDDLVLGTWEVVTVGAEQPRDIFRGDISSSEASSSYRTVNRDLGDTPLRSSNSDGGENESD